MKEKEFLLFRKMIVHIFLTKLVFLRELIPRENLIYFQN